MKGAVLVVGAGACLALAAAPAPRLLWNATASVPVGLYRLERLGAVRVGDLVVVRPPPDLAAFLADGSWLPRGVPLLKPVAAVDGALVCRQGARVLVDGRPAALALDRDAHGRPLPRWAGCRRLAPGDVFLLAPAPGSLDGRYFAVTERADLLARAHPVWIPSPELAR